MADRLTKYLQLLGTVIRNVNRALSNGKGLDMPEEKSPVEGVSGSEEGVAISKAG